MLQDERVKREVETPNLMMTCADNFQPHLTDGKLTASCRSLAEALFYARRRETLAGYLHNLWVFAGKYQEVFSALSAACRQRYEEGVREQDPGQNIAAASTCTMGRGWNDAENITACACLIALGLP